MSDETPQTPEEQTPAPEAEPVVTPDPAPQPDPVVTPEPDPDATSELPPVVVSPAPVPPAAPGLDQETEYKLPAAILEQHEYSRATVIELRRVRHAINTLTWTIQQALIAPLEPEEVELKEPAKVKRHR